MACCVSFRLLILFRCTCHLFWHISAFFFFFFCSFMQIRDIHRQFGSVPYIPVFVVTSHFELFLLAYRHCKCFVLSFDFIVYSFASPRRPCLVIGAFLGHPNLDFIHSSRLAPRPWCHVLSLLTISWFKFMYDILYSQSLKVGLWHRISPRLVAAIIEVRQAVSSRWPLVH